DLGDRLGSMGRNQAEHLGGIVHPAAMEVEIRGDPLEISGAIEHERSQPGPVRARAEDRRVTLLPAAFEIGPSVGLVAHASPQAESDADTRGGRQWTAAYIIRSSVASAGVNSSTMRPWRQTRMRSDRFMISGR